jgi:integrase
VRVSAKKMSIPDILTIDEMQKLISAVHLRLRVLIFLDLVTGLRRGELADFKRANIDF